MKRMRTGKALSISIIGFSVVVLGIVAVFVVHFAMSSIVEFEGQFYSSTAFLNEMKDQPLYCANKPRIIIISAGGICFRTEAEFDQYWFKTRGWHF